jgi:membrane protein YdbS with pleckstrin-like domain
MNTFSNTVLNISELPKLEELNYNALHPKYLWVSMIYRLVVFLPVIGFAVINNIEPVPYFTAIISGALGVIILIFILGYFSFFKKAYALREKDLTYKSGLIFHKITTVPLNRIQHTEVVHGPIARIFGLAHVKIYTAGGSTSDMIIPGIENEKAEQIREFINDKMKQGDEE